MAARSNSFPCLIIGAGLSGLVAARKLQDAGIRPTILEREQYVGGRIATRQVPDFPDDEARAIFDYGAQFFTAREPRFAVMVDRWLERGVVSEWSQGFAAGDGSYYADGHPRYRGQPTMSAIPEDLANDLDIRLDQQVVTISSGRNEWTVTTDNNSIFTARSLILTTPVPISLELLKSGATSLPEQIRKTLEKIEYDPCLAMMVTTNGPGSLPSPGGMWPFGEPIEWLADNHQKGVSPRHGSFTIHAGPEFSRLHWNGDDKKIGNLLLAAAEPWIGSSTISISIHRWRYSRPLWTYPDPCLGISSPALLVFAGDAFAGPRIEGAALSGLAAGSWLLANGRW